MIFVPTYNERENLGVIYTKIKELGIQADILFLDDNSPDGTGEIADRIALGDPSVRVVHRMGKLGIGSAHLAGIRWAYDHGYRTLVTMDCDFTHQPEDILVFLRASAGFDIVVGSRYMDPKSLADWNLFRKTLTAAGHFLTKHLLKMPYDATGAFRLYSLETIPRRLFDRVSSNGYSFFFESLHILSLNGLAVKEIPILLPIRTYGHSKMTLKDAWGSLALLIRTYFRTLFHEKDYLLAPCAAGGSEPDPSCAEKEWDEYWRQKHRDNKGDYDRIAEFYRKYIIKRALNHFIEQEFAAGSRLLHAGCGSGQVDTDVVRRIQVTALDISRQALERYQALHGSRCRVIHGDISQIPSEDAVFDGIYNLGVMEHFSEEDIQRILLEFHRVLKPDGRLVLFWPPEFGLSVRVLKFAHFVLNRVLRKNVKLHPDEITRVRSKAHVRKILERAQFRLKRYYFGPRDFFTHSIVIAEKTGRRSPEAAAAGLSTSERFA